MTNPDNDVLLRREGGRVTLTINRPGRRNSLDDPTIQRFHRLLDEIERAPEIRMIVLEGNDRVFCSGMDLQAFVSGVADVSGAERDMGDKSVYMGLLERLSTGERIVVAKVTGEVAAGGVGLVAASDLVVAGSKATFALPEALWGLLPAMVMPFLVRRVGYQCAFRMTLTTQPIDVVEAHRIHLVDAVDPNPETLIQNLAQKLLRLHPQTVSEMKAYSRKMWIVDAPMQQFAVQELGRLVREPRVRQNIRNYVERGRLPWDTE